MTKDQAVASTTLAAAAALVLVACGDDLATVGPPIAACYRGYQFAECATEGAVDAGAAAPRFACSPTEGGRRC
jgi:hypothetical protein